MAILTPTDQVPAYAGVEPVNATQTNWERGVSKVIQADQASSLKPVYDADYIRFQKAYKGDQRPRERRGHAVYKAGTHPLTGGLRRREAAGTDERMMR